MRSFHEYLPLSVLVPALLADFGGCRGARRHGSVFSGVVKLVRIEFSGRVRTRPINGAVNGFVERHHFLVTEFSTDTG